MEFMGDTGDALDPRIQIELENLNSATEDINKLESELDEAQSLFKQLYSDLDSQLSEITSKIGSSCVDKAKCYYKALEEARRAQVQCQQQVQLFQRASEFHAAAKKSAASAELRCMSSKQEANFDQSWQDMLNQATTKVMHAANQKAECEKEHLQKALIFHNAERKAQEYQKKYQRAIIKARPYFEVWTIYNEKFEMQKQQVDCLKKAIRDAKRNYAKSFKALEDISNQIHEHRRAYANGPREPGVGAELLTPDMNSNHEDDSNKEILKLEHRAENINNRLVDGSETTQTQWEIEFQSNLKNLPSKEEQNCEESSLNLTGSHKNSPMKCQDSFNKIPQEKRREKMSTNEWQFPVLGNCKLVKSRWISKSLGDIPANASGEFNSGIKNVVKSVQKTPRDY
ncbi:SH3 domain-binding protein 5 homolog [Fopius arisanus]|uniref:SH3 domain-binding protein 5 homolog n=1 Tax=Fopius arisanus TaxID=64838 RepID=A0A9R1U391_9HYME|nr:PREDICTED: SH3 domain-binding protein 5 homolog [Fopius arisanus]